VEDAVVVAVEGGTDDRLFGSFWACFLPDRLGVPGGAGGVGLLDGVLTVADVGEDFGVNVHLNGWISVIAVFECVGLGGCSRSEHIFDTIVYIIDTHPGGSSPRRLVNRIRTVPAGRGDHRLQKHMVSSREIFQEIRSVNSREGAKPRRNKS